MCAVLSRLRGALTLEGVDQIAALVFSQLRNRYSRERRSVGIDFERGFTLPLIEKVLLEFLSIFRRRRLIIADALVVIGACRRGENRSVLQDARQIVVSQQAVVHLVGVVFGFDLAEATAAEQPLRFGVARAAVVDLELDVDDAR